MQDWIQHEFFKGPDYCQCSCGINWDRASAGRLKYHNQTTAACHYMLYKADFERGGLYIHSIDSFYYTCNEDDQERPLKSPTEAVTHLDVELNELELWNHGKQMRVVCIHASYTNGDATGIAKTVLTQDRLNSQISNRNLYPIYFHFE